MKMRRNHANRSRKDLQPFDAPAKSWTFLTRPTKLKRRKEQSLATQFCSETRDHASGHSESQRATILRHLVDQGLWVSRLGKADELFLDASSRNFLHTRSLRYHVAGRTNRICQYICADGL